MRTGVRRFAALFALGLTGIIALAPTTGSAVAQLRDQMARQRGQSPADLPPDAVLTALALVQPAALLAIAVLVGMRFAPATGLRSHLDRRVRGEPPEGPGLLREVPLAVALGTVVAIAILLLDAVVRPMLGGAIEQLAGGTSRSASITIAGMLYGGITEELLIRWGLMSLLLALLWRIAERRKGRLEPAADVGGQATPEGPAEGAGSYRGGAQRPGSAGLGSTPGSSAAWAAIVVSALSFGAAHLPAVATMVSLTPMLAVRTIALNTIGGIAFGWLFWRRSLEAAMIAHATVHVVFTLAEVLLVASVRIASI